MLIGLYPTILDEQGFPRSVSTHQFLASNSLEELKPYAVQAAREERQRQFIARYGNEGIWILACFVPPPCYRMEGPGGLLGGLRSRPSAQSNRTATVKSRYPEMIMCSSASIGVGQTTFKGSLSWHSLQRAEKRRFHRAGMCNVC